jgi:predicted RNase H-like HicB family nuclease
MRHAIQRSRPPPKTLRLTGEVWREGRMYTAYCRELDIASCGRTVEEAWRNLHEAFEIFLEETAKKGTLHTLLEEASLVAQGETLERPEYFIGRIELPLPASR